MDNFPIQSDLFDETSPTGSSICNTEILPKRIMIKIREDMISTKKRENYSQTLLFFESNNKKSEIEFF